MTTTRTRYTVALTGGIASGKSAVSDRFGALGADVIDADLVSRELVAPGGAALAEIAAAFGPGVLASDGSLDRRAMRAIVFADDARRRGLEAILHPRVRDILRERAHAGAAAYAVLVIPLLVESGHYDWVDRVLVVDVPRELQRARLVARDGITPTLADAMLDAQASREQRLAIADDVITNDGTLADLDARVRDLHERYLALARGASGSVHP
ncbi:MAG: dephospho-CoA kinase [Lysobacteraceae bacterium]|nr:MAG: dephospho-CoA kinase [Xanthomonadaceae bacterium]